jgi:hypothetical protein
MTEPEKPQNVRTAPIKPKVVDGIVVVENPAADPLELTADAADISARRLTDAADAARKKFWLQNSAFAGGEAGLYP